MSTLHPTSPTAETTIPPVFVVGAPRSGTTFLTRLLNQYFDVHVARDGGTILRFHSLTAPDHRIPDRKTLETVVNALFSDYFFKKRFLERGLTLTPEEVLAQFSGQTYADLIHFIMMEMARQHGKRRWGNKRPSYALHITELAQIFPEARFLHIVRDGRDVAYSMRRAKSSAFERNWYFAIKDWAHHVTVARNQGQQLPDGRYLEIFYEALMQDPVQVMQQIIPFLGDTNENESRLERYETEIRQLIKPGNFEKWKREIPPSAIRIMERAAGPTLQAFGYPLMFPEVAGTDVLPPQKMIFAVDNMVRKMFSSTARKAFQYRLEWLKTRLRLHKA